MKYNNNDIKLIYNNVLRLKFSCDLLIRKNKKSPRGIKPCRCISPPPRGVKYVTVTQDKSHERHDKYLASDHQKKKKKKKNGKKMGITRPRPDGGEKRD